MAIPIKAKDCWCVGMFGALAAIVIGLFQSTASDAMGNLAVVYPPWTRSADAIARAAAAGSVVVRPGTLPFVIIVHPLQPTFVRIALRDGALVILDASSVAGCGKPGGRRP